VAEVVEVVKMAQRFTLAVQVVQVLSS